MGLSARVVVCSVIAVSGAVACGFDAVGTGVGAPGTSDIVGRYDGGPATGGEGGSSGGVLPPANHDAQVGPPACDTAKDPACLPLPAGWRLVATAANAAPAPACPAGYGTASDVVASPTPRADACDCSACTIAAKPTCAGAVQVKYDYAGVCDSTSQTPSNSPPGACGTDVYNGDYSNEYIKYTMPLPSGGSCAPGAPTPHLERVDFAEHARLCDGNARCSGAVCDARVTAPFKACVARDGDVACPTGFAEKRVVGAGATFACASTCGCTVAGRTCSPMMKMFPNGNCSGTPLTIPIDGTCRKPGFSGSYGSYQVATTPAATCTATGGNPAASSAALTMTTTVCCR